MNIYKISQSVNNEYDTFDSAVVIAENARLRDALERIESIFVDGSDTYEDWKAMGGIARDILANASRQEDKTI